MADGQDEAAKNPKAEDGKWKKWDWDCPFGAELDIEAKGTSVEFTKAAAHPGEACGRVARSQESRLCDMPFSIGLWLRQCLAGPKGR
jgi:hypothetical protein